MFSGGLFAGLPVATASTDILYLGGHEIVLVEGRANEVSVPHVEVDGIDTRLMYWQDSLNEFVTSATPTRISDYVRQLNKRYLGSDTLNPTLVTRVETVDADSGDRRVFTPGATPVGSLHDFEVIIEDQDGDYESRGFLIFLADDANGGSIDGGDVVLRLTPEALPW
jgi:hypothetical protein